MKTNFYKKLIFVVILINIVTIGDFGCSDLFSTTNVRETTIRPQILTTYSFEDVPIPTGMTLNRKESFIYETGRTKAGLLVYEGKGEIERLASFFKQQMPNYKWRLVSNFELHNVMLTFIKEGWSSVVYIIPVDNETKRIEIRVGPVEIKVIP